MPFRIRFRYDPLRILNILLLLTLLTSSQALALPNPNPAETPTSETSPKPDSNSDKDGGDDDEKICLSLKHWIGIALPIHAAILFITVYFTWTGTKHLCHIENNKFRANLQKENDEAMKDFRVEKGEFEREKGEFEKAKEYFASGMQGAGRIKKPMKARTIATAGGGDYDSPIGGGGGGGRNPFIASRSMTMGGQRMRENEGLSDGGGGIRRYLNESAGATSRRRGSADSEFVRPVYGRAQSSSARRGVDED